ncbi:MAG: aldehyde dehydrogenase family protein [Bacteroidota bacterium]
MERFQTISPVDGSVYCERAYATPTEIASALNLAKHSQSSWQRTGLAERAAVCRRVIEYFEKNVDAISEEITWQMGRPIVYTPFEIIKGFKERANYMIDIAEKELAPMEVEDGNEFVRRVTKEPLGTILVLSPWNYPYLTPVNAVIPAVMAGNTVILKHADQTPLCAERFGAAFEYANAPEGVFQYLHLSHDQIPGIIQDQIIGGVAFTGSVGGGQAIQRAVGERFITAGLELGGKDPAYVAADAHVQKTAENLVDGAYFNSGQSCCGVERIYVHEKVYDELLDHFRSITAGYVVGNPTLHETTLGPMVRPSAASKAIDQLKEAVAMGGELLIPSGTFAEKAPPYFNPQAVIGVNHDMHLMQEESFAPVVGIMSVASDEEAIELMNDSPYGLSASVWTTDADRALSIGRKVETGTWFMNRCDYLDPALAWTGVKASGKGCTLSALGYQYLTRPKSYHLKLSL